MPKQFRCFLGISHNVFTNYRPVSLLPQFSKILEKIFDNRLDSFIEKYNILSGNQYGFRTKHSTSLSLIALLNDICNVSKILKFILFADDTNCFYTGSDFNNICNVITLELEHLNVWFALNKLN